MNEVIWVVQKNGTVLGAASTVERAQEFAESMAVSPWIESGGKLILEPQKSTIVVTKVGLY